ncbi:hypothetical protein EDD83_04375 [Methanohalophilus euhalobius]|uniref:Uncharacterized protein n=1 Tax=Methanohalophilus euhalobius TaxID=51203 RepID=A0A3M9LA24_9EURY|nr:hypothetical protein EDD83_04375 [Methanohalophilus euhalobius]
MWGRGGQKGKSKESAPIRGSKPSNSEPIIVDMDREMRKVKKDMASLGICRPVYVRFNPQNMK